MALDLASLIDVSHLVTFLGGTAVGAAASYMADRLTDRRRSKEVDAEAKRRYSRIQKLLPELIAELTADLRRPENRLIREFVVLSSDRVTFNHDRSRFEYYESNHPEIHNQVRFLIDSGYVRDVSTTSHPIYRMSDEFVDYLDGG